MNICTIITENWIDSHLVRWARYIKKNVPNAKLYLIYAGYNRTHPVLNEFTGIHAYSGVVDRYWLNSVRMGACKLFGVDEILYLDADSDVLSDISDIPTLSDAPVMCAKSPYVHKGCVEASQKLGYGACNSVMNNGLLYLRGDLSDAYDDAWDKVEQMAISNRIMGTVAFNVMLWGGVKHFELPYDYSVIWWDAEHMMSAKGVQYCNDEGQKKRVNLEALWQNAR